MKIRRTFLRLFTGTDFSRRSLPVMTADSGLAGPLVWLTAGAHGDEIGGVVVIQEVFRALEKHGLQGGTLKALPLLNPIGFDSCTRRIPVSEEDLNRSFPGRANGSLAERMAARIFETLMESPPELVLDLHNDWTRSIPYCVLDPGPAGSPLDRARELARATAFPVVSEGAPLRHTLSHSLLQRGVTALTVELGESNVVNEENVALGTAAVLRVLCALGLVDGGSLDLPFVAPHDSAASLAYSERPLCSVSGIIRFRVAPGELVKKGQVLAVVGDAFGRRCETLRAEEEALVLGVADSSVAYPGAPVVALGQT